MDMWCKQNDIIHRLIPVGVKELNGKVENTHKQDDREFFSQGTYKSYESLELNTRGYNERWNGQRKTRALGNKTPNQVIETAAVRAIVLMLHLQTEKNKAAYNINQDGDAFIAIPKPANRLKKKIKTRKPSFVETYLKYVEWDEAKKKLPALITYPSMSQNFSRSNRGRCGNYMHCIKI
jgi:hypothetical protein